MNVFERNTCHCEPVHTNHVDVRTPMPDWFWYSLIDACFHPRDRSLLARALRAAVLSNMNTHTVCSLWTNADVTLYCHIYDVDNRYSPSCGTFDRLVSWRDGFPVVAASLRAAAADHSIAATPGSSNKSATRGIADELADLPLPRCRSRLRAFILPDLHRHVYKPRESQATHGRKLFAPTSGRRFTPRRKF